MKRLLIGLVVSLVAMLAFAGTASAAPSQTFQSHFNGLFAQAVWDSDVTTSTGTTETFTDFEPSRATNGRQGLFVVQVVVAFDSNGDFTGVTTTQADVTSGFSFTIDNKLFSTASLTATGIPAQTCTRDADSNEICSDTTIDVSASWTGQGPISKSQTIEHFHSPGVTENDHFSGTNRDATATGTFDGVSLAAGDIQQADLGSLKQGITSVCVGSGC